MDALEKILEMTPQKYQSSGESLIISPEIKIPFLISAGSSPLPENGLPVLGEVKPGSRVDGRWVILQDWSQCTQACGGGKQYLQRLCIQPQNGGNNCIGDPILARNCNEQSCPNVIQTEKQAITDLPPIISMRQISNKALRFEVL